MREKERSRSDARGELRSSQRINPGSRAPLDTSTNPVDLQRPALGVEGARERSGAVRAECRRGGGRVPRSLLLAFRAVSPRRLLPAGCGHKSGTERPTVAGLERGGVRSPSRQFEVLAEAHRRAAHHRRRTATVATSELDLGTSLVLEMHSSRRANRASLGGWRWGCIVTRLGGCWGPGRTRSTCDREVTFVRWLRSARHLRHRRPRRARRTAWRVGHSCPIGRIDVVAIGYCEAREGGLDARGLGLPITREENRRILSRCGQGTRRAAAPRARVRRPGSDSA
jgi:hypothetical protein